jgi:hypothetical protein
LAPDWEDESPIKSSKHLWIKTPWLQRCKPRWLCGLTKRIQIVYWDSPAHSHFWLSRHDRDHFYLQQKLFAKEHRLPLTRWKWKAQTATHSQRQTSSQHQRYLLFAKGRDLRIALTKT